MSEITEKILDMLEERLQLLGLTRTDVALDKSILDQGILDSISFLELLTQIEQELGLVFDFGEMEPSDFNTLDKLSKIIEDEN